MIKRTLIVLGIAFLILVVPILISSPVDKLIGGDGFNDKPLLMSWVVGCLILVVVVCSIGLVACILYYVYLYIKEGTH